MNDKTESRRKTTSKFVIAWLRVNDMSGCAISALKPDAGQQRSIRRQYATLLPDSKVGLVYYNIRFLKAAFPL